MKSHTLRLLMVSLAAFLAALTPSKAQTSIWNNGGNDSSWIDKSNWVNGSTEAPTVVGSSATVEIQTQPTNNLIGIDTGVQSNTIASLTFTLTLPSPNTATSMTLEAGTGVEQLTVDGPIDNQSAETIYFTLPVIAGANALYSDNLSGGTSGTGSLVFDNGLTVGTEAITTAGNVAISGSLVFTINGSTPGQSNATYGTIGPITTSSATAVSIDGTYSSAATLASDAGDFFRLSTGSFTGATVGSLPAFSDTGSSDSTTTSSPGLTWVTSLIQKGILFVEPSATAVTNPSTTYINTGVTLPIGNDTEFNGTGTAIILNGGTLLTSNDSSTDTGGTVGTPFSTNRAIMMNAAGTLAATTGTTATYGTGSVISGSGALTIGSTGNTGTVTLSAPSTYTAATTVADGTLEVANTTGSATGTNAVTLNSGTALTGAAGSSISGQVNLSGTNTISSLTGTLTVGSLHVAGTGNTLSAGTVAGNATQTAGSALAVNGTLNGTDSLTAGATALTGDGHVGVVTLNGGGNTVSGVGGTLTTAGITVTGGTTNNTISSGTVAGNVTQGAASALAVNGTLTGTDTLAAGATSLTGTGSIGGVTLNGGGNTVSSTGTLASGGLTVNGTNNTISGGTVSGAITQNSGSALAVNGTGGNDALNTGATLTGTGTVGTVTLAGTDTLNSTTGDTLTTSGITVGGTGNTIASVGTVSGPITYSGTSALTVNGAASGTVAVGSGASLNGTGSTGAVTVTSGGTINLASETAIGTLTVGGLSTTAGALTFAITSGTTNNLDKIADTGSLTVGAGSTTITISNLNGNSTTLTNGLYSLITYTGSASGLGNLTLSTTSLDGKTLSLVTTNSGVVDLNVANTVLPPTNGQYSLATTVTGSTFVHETGTTTLVSSITNTGTGQQDSLSYSGLTASGTTGTPGSGSGLAQGATGNSGTLTYTAGTTLGAVTVTPTVTSVTNTTASGTPTLTGTTSATLNVYSGQSVWAGTSTGGSWGTLTGTGANTFGLNWGANQGSPGLDPNFADTDTATFNNVAGQATQTVSLTGASPSLLGITFSAPATTYTLAQGTGGTLTLNGGAGSASVTNTAGTQTISAPVVFATNTNIAVSSGATMVFSGNISGAGGATTTGSGNTIFSGTNTYTAMTAISSGTLTVTGSTLSTGTVTVANGGTLSGTGALGNTSVAGGGNIDTQDGVIGTLTVHGLTLNGTSGTPSTLSFDIGAGSTGNLDKIADSGTLTLSNSGGTVIDIGNVSGTPTLTNGTYTLISSTGITGSLSDLTLGTSVLDGKSLTLSIVGNNVDLTVATEVNAYTLAATAANSRILVNTGSTIITDTLTNDATTTLTYTGLDLTATSGSVSAVTPSSGTAGANGGSSSGTATFTAGSTTGAVTITPGVGTAVTGSGAATQAGNTPATVDVVAMRTITAGAATSLGVLHSGATVDVTANSFTSTGLNDTTTSVAVAGGDGTPDGNGVTLTGDTTDFTGTTLNATGATQTFGGTVTSNTGGAINGTFDLGVTTLENGGAGLTGEGPYSSVPVAYTAFVYTGQGVYDGAGSSSWGTISAAPPNWTADGGVPGITPGFVSTDSATFGNSIGATTATVTLDGDSPSLNAITFSNTDGGSYILAQGTGGSLLLDGGTNSAVVTDSATAAQTISAPVSLVTSANVDVTSAAPMTFSGVVSGAGGLAATGTGTLILSGANTYSGGTVISAGTLQVGDGATANGSLGTAGVTDNAALVFDPFTTSTIANAITGSGTVTQDGPGTTILTSAGSTYAGATTVSTGTLQIGNGVSGSLSANSAVTVAGGATLAFDAPNGSAQTNAIADAGTVAGAEGSGVANTLSGVISGAGAVTQTGAGATLLTNANTYSGGTTISNGILAVGNLAALGTGAVTMSGGVLETANGVHEINVGTNYTQSGGTLFLTLAATPDVNGLNPANDILNAATVTLSGNAKLTLDFTFVPVKGEVFTLVDTSGGITGTTPGFTTPDVTPPGYVVTTAETMNGDELQATVISTQLGLTNVLGSDYTPNRAAILNYIDSHVTSGPLYTAIGTALAGTNNPSAIAADIADQESQENFGNFVRSTIFNNASFFTQGFDSYMEGQHSANGFLTSNGQIDSSGLTVVNSETDPALGQVSSQLLAWSPAPYAHGLLSDTTDPVTTGLDSKEMTTQSAAAENGRDFNAFVLGNVVLAQGFSQGEVPHSDSTTGSVEVGADYRLTPHLRVGALFGYGHTDADLDDNGSTASIDSYSPAVYLAFAQDGWYANALGSYGFDNYTEDRHLSIGGVSAVAQGSPNGDQIIGNLDGGYDFHHGALTFGPTAGVQYTHLDVDSFSETGAGALASDENVGNENSDSLRSRLGGHASYVFQTGKVLLTPHLDASWQHEFMDQSRGITSQFSDVGAGSFVVNTPNPSRDSALIDAGMSADLNRQVSLYLDYLVQAGQSDYFGQSVQVGVKVGF